MNVTSKDIRVWVAQDNQWRRVDRKRIDEQRFGINDARHNHNARVQTKSFRRIDKSVKDNAPICPSPTWTIVVFLLSVYQNTKEKKKNKTFLSSMRVAFRRRGQKIKQKHTKKKAKKKKRCEKIPTGRCESPRLPFFFFQKKKRDKGQQLSNNEVADVFVSFPKRCVFSF